MYMEGSRLTNDQTRYIFETNTIGMESEVLNVNEVIETANDFRCIDMIIDHAKSALTEKFRHKYMKTFGFKVNNDAFVKNSWYFRNALVRANYNDLQNGVYSTTKFLEMFFSNLILRTGYELKNRYMHVAYVPEQSNNIRQSAIGKGSKGKICTLNCPLDELAILQLIMENPNITQKEMADRIGKSERTVKNKIASLKEKGYIQRLNGKRSGKF